MSDTPHRYTAELAGQIEVAWQDRWQERGTFHAPNPAGPWADPEGVATHPNGHLLVLDMFPYPSGAGLHVGHPLGYIATDVFARFNRMLGRNVLHCLGYDAFGLPAEQYAVQTGQHPRKTTEDNIVIMARQLRRLGLGHDDRRAIQTIDPQYYRWTQWIFLQIFNSWYDADAVRPDGSRGRARPIAELVEEYRSGARALPNEDGRDWDDLSDLERANILDAQRLAYTSEAPVNWCPGLGTVLSNEEVTNEGRSERGNFPVFKRNLRQWMMRITAYADRLADDLDRVDWPEKVRVMQRNWIGRSSGARVAFPIAPARSGHRGVHDPPRHPVRRDLHGPRARAPPRRRPRPRGGWPEGTRPPGPAGRRPRPRPSTAYRLAASRKTDIERQTEGKDKTGVFTGGWATNPVTGTRPGVRRRLRAHGLRHRRDHGRARPGRARLGLRDGVRPADHPHRPAAEDHDTNTAFTGEGPAINSSNDEVSLDGLGVAEAKARITA